MSNHKPPPEDFFKENPQFNFKQVISRIQKNWHWFLISLLLCLFVAFLYLRYTAPVYKTTSEILITEDKAPNPADDVISKAFGGQFGMGNSVDGEAEILKTRLIMGKVVRELKTYIKYYHKGKIRLVELYKTTPFVLHLLNSPDSILPQQLEIKMIGTKVEVTGEDFVKQVNLYQAFRVPGLGNVQIEKGEEEPDPEQIYTVKIATVNKTIIDYMKKLDVSIPIIMVKILQLNFTDEVPRKSEDVLNKLTELYISGTLSDKNRVADSTIAFIENRLVYVGKELGHIEGNVQTFKQQNKLTDISAQSTQLISSTKESVNDLAKAETQLSVLAAVEKHLTQAGAAESIVPSGALLDDPSFGSLVERYNTIVLEKEKKSISQTEDNPYMQNLNAQIARAKADMLAGLRSLKKSLLISKSKLESQSNTIAGQVRNVPAVERTYLDLARQQQIKQELYVFLLKKREETAISKTSNISNCRIIEPPISLEPISPIKVNVIGYAIVLGLLIPAGSILLKEKLYTRIISKEQIRSATSVPIIGEIGHNSVYGESIVVSEQARTSIAEQFRSLRTNLSFFLKGEDKTILLTSSMSGEGKSFISINLATVLAISGKKVVVMEMDLRKPNLSNKLNLKNDFGFTNYVVNKDLHPQDIVVPSGLNENLFIISSGRIPPNPTEIIMTERTEALMKSLSAQFDYVIIDAPPIGMVTDAQLLSKYAQLNLYVVRQHYTYKEQLAILQDLYANEKMKNIAILVNDMKNRSGYGYGYAYGYGYGYGMEPQKEGFFKKLFKR